MTRPQHFGWFFSRGFGPQAWGRDAWEWGWDWRRPDLYQHSVRELERAGFDIVIAEDAVSLGGDETLALRVDGAYGGPKHDPLMLAPYLFAATERIGIAPTINAGITPPYLAARQLATLQHLSGGRMGVNLVTDVKSARHVGAEELGHDAAYDRAEEWIAVVRRLWRSWGEGALVEDAASGRFADASRLDAFRHEGEYFRVAGPLNAVPADAEPTIVSPGGSGPGLAFAGRNSDVQLALAPLTPEAITAYRERIHAAAREQGRSPEDIRVLFVVKPELVDSAEEADRVVAASLAPTDDELRGVLAAWSSDLETDLVSLDLDAPLSSEAFGQHVSQGTIRGLRAGTDPDAPLRAIATARSRKGRLASTGSGDGAASAAPGLVGTAEEFADLVERLGDVGNDGFILSGDLHPTTLHRMLDRLVPVLRRRGLLRRELGDGGLQQNLFDF